MIERMAVGSVVARRLASAVAPLLYFAASTALFFRAILFTGHQFHIPYDLYEYHYPLTELIAWSLRQFRQLPWWNPFSYCGEPFSGNITTAMFYPATLPVVALGNLLYGRVPYSFMEMQVVAHVFFAGLGAYVLLRRLGCWRAPALLGGTVFQLGAFFASQTQHLGAVAGAAWIPWLALATRHLAERRNFAGLSATAVVLALMVLAGFPAIFLPAYVFGGLWVLCWAYPSKGQGRSDSPLKPLARLAGPLALYAGACLLSAALAAVALLPAFDVARLSVATLRPRQQAVEGFAWEALTSLLVPNFFSQLRGNYWGFVNYTFMYLYQGLPALLLVVAGLALKPARRVVVFWVSAAFAFLWMFGGRFFLSEIIFMVFPGFAARGIYPEFVLAFFSLSFAALAAFSLQALGEDELRVEVRLWKAAALAAFALGLVGYAVMPAFSDQATQQRLANAAGSLQYAALILLACCLILGRMTAAAPSGRGAFSALLVAVAVIDLVAAGSSTAPNTYPGNVERPEKRRGIEEPAEVLKIIADHAPPGEPYRIDTSDLPYSWQTIFPLHRVASANGMSAVLLLDYLRYRSAFSTSTDRQFRLDDARSPLLNLLNVRYVVSTQEEIPGLERISKGWHKVFENRRALPRFYLVGQVLPVKSSEQAMGILKEGDPDPRLAAVVQGEGIPDLPWKPGQPSPGAVQLTLYSPNEIRLEVQANRACLLVAAETYWPEWRAQVDGYSQPVFRANAIQRGVFLPAGRHSVRFLLVPVKVYVGGAISLVALVSVLLGWLLSSRRERALALERQRPTTTAG